ncbi:hypothetical protein G7068_15900 [Leucobacter viscericola]|uniref:Glutaredoxin n=1 Tax=Leucobacter viscericola TaxID=2714935 RepID=A0A6G7XJC0_9MICO|nr:hypothetical protein [Leucobacter viscericola]QIK64529.1 hypothetical protein G7068_15900 [Leucobacter viscericola]
MPTVTIPQEHSITVYSKQRGCMACTITKRWLLEREIDFSVENIEAPENRETAAAFAIKSAPMVIAEPSPITAESSEIVFSDFRVDVLESLFPADRYPKTRTISTSDVDELAPTPELQIDADEPELDAEAEYEAA